MWRRRLRGQALLWAAQRDDGSWLGFCGINVTYAILHVVKAMRATGVSGSDRRLARAATWLLSHQRPDGDWGDHYTSCLSERYVEHPQPQVVMTSGAILALCELETLGLGNNEERRAAIRRGVAWLEAQQRPEGSFPEQAQNGVFFGTARLDYRLYKSDFPVWALARAARLLLAWAGAGAALAWGLRHGGLSARTALIADDDPDSLAAVSASLVALGLRVRCAHEGAEFIPHLVKTGPYGHRGDRYRDAVDARRASGAFGPTR